MKNKKKLYVILGVLAAVLLGALILFGILIFPKLQTGNEIAELLQPILSAENQSTHVAVSTDIAGEQIHMETDLYSVKEDESNYLIMQQQDYAFYIVDGMFILENGNAYKLSEETETGVSFDGSLFQKILVLSEIVDIGKVEAEGKVHYSMSITGEEVKELLATLRMDQYEEINAIKELKLSLSAKDGVLETIAIVGTAKVKDAAVDITILFSDFVILEENTNMVPQEIKDIVQTVDKNTLFDLSKDLYRLISAAYEFTNRDILDGTVELQANCGIISFKKEYKLSELRAEQTPVTNAEEVEGIPAGIAFVCLEGEISCTQEENRYVYALELDEADMENLVYSIAPEVESLVPKLTSGKAYVTVENGVISGMEIQIEGAINMLITEVDASVGAKFIFK